MNNAQPNTNKEKNTIAGLLNNNFRGNSENADRDLKDGYWIVIQNWTKCNLACGGGKSYLQRMCVPPKNNGKPCKGEAVLTRDCNMQKCPEVFQNNKKLQFRLKENEKNNFLIDIDPEDISESSPKVNFKLLGRTRSPLRYDKCHLKEGDFFISLKGKKESLIPVRVTMNKYNLSAFTGDDYDSNVISFNLKDSSFFIDGNDKNCFSIKNSVKSALFCSYLTSASSVDEWNYDFHLFKFQCNYTNKNINNNMNSNEKSISDTFSNFNNSLNQIKRNTVSDDFNYNKIAYNKSSNFMKSIFI